MNVRGAAATALGLCLAATFAASLPAAADEAQNIGIVTSVDRAHATFICACAENDLADMSRAKRTKAAYRTSSATTFERESGDAAMTFASLRTGATVIVEYHVAGGSRLVDELTLQREDCRPKFCGP